MLLYKFGMDPKKTPHFWEKLGFIYLFVILIVVGLLKYVFHANQIVEVIKMIGIFFTLLILFAYVVLILKMLSFKEEEKMKELQKRKAFEEKIGGTTTDPEKLRWLHIRERLLSTNPADWHMAVIDADAMLDLFLSFMGYREGSVGEKLKMVPPHTPWLQDLWYVHKLRNKLAHEGTQARMTNREAQKVMKILEEVFYAYGFLKE